MYICEKCGKLVTENYGSGRFCSKSCANSRHHSEETKMKISKSLSGVYRNIRRDKSTGLYLNYCVICKKAFYGNTSYSQTCSKECLRELQHRKSLGNTGGGYREGSVKHFKYGYYKEFHCDSSYELAFIVYCLDHNIPIQRNKQWFEYSYLNKLHKYYPDFLVNNTTYVEIKNYHTDIVQAKINYFPKDLDYVIIYKKDIQKYINYCKQLYGDNFCEVLYEKDKPNYFNKM